MLRKTTKRCAGVGYSKLLVGEVFHGLTHHGKRNTSTQSPRKTETNLSLMEAVDHTGIHAVVLNSNNCNATADMIVYGTCRTVRVPREEGHLQKRLYLQSCDGTFTQM